VEAIEKVEKLIIIKFFLSSFQAFLLKIKAKIPYKKKNKGMRRKNK